MKWGVRDVVLARIEFIKRYHSGERMSELCREFEVSRTTGYFWVNRFSEEPSIEGLKDRSHRPHRSPNQTAEELESRVIELRKKYGWGAKKLRVLLLREEIDIARITIARIIARNNLIPERNKVKQAVKRFQRESPNELWQVDFKGPMAKGEARCEPLTVLDDCSRYVISSYAARDKGTAEVRSALTKAFKQHGMPDSILFDHGTPWWATRRSDGISQLSVWLMKQDIEIRWSGFAHPQTQGKVERFHRTLDEAVFRKGTPSRFSQWSPLLREIRDEYNHVRPHESLDMEVPASRYTPSKKPYSDKPSNLPEYCSSDLVKKVTAKGYIQFNKNPYFISESLAGEYVKLDYLEPLLLVSYRKTIVGEFDVGV